MVLFKIFIIAFIILLSITILFIILKNHKRQATQIISIQTFLGSNSYNLLENEPIEQKKSLIETIKDYFFNDKDDENIDDGNDDIGDGDGDAGE